MESSTFIVGGARSGKSRFAVAEQPARAGVTFVATAQARDADMARRIARHRAERPSHWRTVEEPLDLVWRLEDLVGRTEAVVVDCLTLWVANRMERGDGDEAILEGGDALSKLVMRRPYALTIVSNEVGEGVHPETAAGRQFRDLLGTVNQHVAAACDRLILMVAGVPLVVKQPIYRHDFGQQAP